jgi:hypothetical protein
MHNKKEDAWTAINGKVYNFTPYLPYHPGGEKELMRVAGRDGTKLFCEIHIHSILPIELILILIRSSANACMGKRGLYARCMSRRISRLGIIRIIELISSNQTSYFEIRRQPFSSYNVIELYFQVYVHTY